MNYSAYACALLGKKALERERVLELLEEIPDLPERAEVNLEDGYLFLELAEPREEEVWALASVLEPSSWRRGRTPAAPGGRGRGRPAWSSSPKTSRLARMYEPGGGRASPWGRRP